jgi:hypothetical protein
MTTTQSTETQAQNAYKVRRENLKELSRRLKLGMKSGAIDAASVNDALIQFYTADGHKEFKTFNQWKELGKSIIKGSKAFVVWGSPQAIQHPDPESENDEFKFWPLCYLFSDKQVAERSQS